MVNLFTYLPIKFCINRRSIINAVLKTTNKMSNKSLYNKCNRSGKSADTVSLVNSTQNIYTLLNKM